MSRQTSVKLMAKQLFRRNPLVDWQGFLIQDKHDHKSDDQYFSALALSNWHSACDFTTKLTCSSCGQRCKFLWDSSTWPTCMPRFTLQGHTEAGMRGTIAAERHGDTTGTYSFSPVFFLTEKRLESCDRRFPLKMTLRNGWPITT